VQKCHNAPRMLISPGFCFSLAFATFLIPLKWVVAWILAVAIHEMGHYIAIRLCSGSVYEVRIGFCGAAMCVELPNTRAEIISAISGPFCGALLVLLGKWFPRVAVCAFVQTAYNFLPISGLDGWHVVRCVVKKRFPSHISERIMSCIEWAVLFGIFMFFIYISVLFRWTIITVIGAVMLAAKAVFIKIPCKQRQQIVQ